MRIPNRILRLDAGGLRYEADPRHVEIITKSLGIENSKTVCSPGVKDYTESDLLGETLDDDMVMVTQLKSDLNLGRGTRSRLCHFDDVPDVRYVQPYGEIYGMKPSAFVFTKSGSMKLIHANADKFTGKSPDVVTNRIR